MRFENARLAREAERGRVGERRRRCVWNESEVRCVRNEAGVGLVRNAVQGGQWVGQRAVRTRAESYMQIPG